MVEQEKLKQIMNESHEYQNMIQNPNTVQKVNGKDNQIAIIGQQAKNYIFFNRDKNFGSYLDEESEQEKKINYQNCRLKSKEEKMIL